MTNGRIFPVRKKLLYRDRGFSNASMLECSAVTWLVIILFIGLDYFQVRRVTDADLLSNLSQKRAAVSSHFLCPYVGSCESVNISNVFLGRWTPVLTHWLPLHALLQVSTVSIAVCSVFADRIVQKSYIPVLKLKVSSKNIVEHMKIKWWVDIFWNKICYIYIIRDN